MSVRRNRSLVASTKRRHRMTAPSVARVDFIALVDSVDRFMDEWGAVVDEWIAQVIAP